MLMIQSLNVIPIITTDELYGGLNDKGRVPKENDCIFIDHYSEGKCPISHKLCYGNNRVGDFLCGIARANAIIFESKKQVIKLEGKLIHI